MTNKLTIAKKAFSVAVAATTILWSVGLSAFLPTAASAATFGDLIKGTTLSTVYYYGSDGQRYSFPNEKSFFSWNNDFSAVKTISDTQLAGITLAGNIAYRPGSRWIKITSDAKVYAVSTTGKIRWIENEATAKGLGGDNWNTLIDDVPDTFFQDYSVGNSLSSPVAGYDGMLWSDGTSTYLVSGAKYSLVTPAGFAANHYKAASVLKGAGFTKSGLSAGADITAGMTNLTDAAQKVTTPTYANSQNVTVALSASSPAASTFISGQAVANLAAFDFTNPTSSPVTVKSLALKRTGVSSDSLLSNVYLFSGFTRLTDAASVSNGVASFNDASGLFTIPAGGTSTINVRSDILCGATPCNTSGQTVGVQLVSANSVGFVGAFAATGSFPISGALNSTANATLATVSFGSSISPAGDAQPAPQSDLTVWQDDVNVSSTQNVMLNSIRFRNIGSINATDVGNWRLYVGGVMYGTAVAQQDANGYVTFDLSAAPLSINSNSHTFKVMADVTGGSTRTMTVGFRSAADAVFVDGQYNQGILVTGTVPANAHAQTINGTAGGSVTFTKRSDSASGDIVKGTSSATLARFDVKASGEPVKIESLNFNVGGTNVVNNTTGLSADDAADYSKMKLRNGSVFVDGNQVGNTSDLCSTTDISCTGTAPHKYTAYTFGSSFVVYPGTPVVLEVRADIYDNETINDLDSTDTLQANIETAGLGTNVFLKTTQSYVTFPPAPVAGNLLTVREGSLSLSKNTSYSNQTIVAPKTGYKIGSYTITSTTAEAVNLTSFVTDFVGSTGTALANGDINNLYINYGPAGSQVAMTAKATPSLASGVNTFSLNYTMQPNKTIYVDLYGDINSSITATAIVTRLALTATANSGATADQAAKSGQAITLGLGSFVGNLDGSTPPDARYTGGSLVTVGKYRFSPTSENYVIDKLNFTIPAAAVGVASDIELWDNVSTTPLATQTFTGHTSVDNDTASFSGLNIATVAGTPKILTVKLTLNTVGTGNAPSQQNTAVTLIGYSYLNSQGSPGPTSPVSGLTLVSNKAIVTKSVPVIDVVDLTNSIIVNETAQKLYSFTVKATGGDVAVKQFVLNTTWSDGGAADALAINNISVQKNSGPKLTFAQANVMDQAGVDVHSTGFSLANSSSKLVVSFPNEDVISANDSVTYSVYGTPSHFRMTGTDIVGDSVSFHMVGDTSPNGSSMFLNNAHNAVAGGIYKLHTAPANTDLGTAENFIWSDASVSGHDDFAGTSSAETSLTGGDWTNGYLVLNLDLPSETWSK